MKNLIKCNSCGWFVIIKSEKDIEKHKLREKKVGCSTCKKHRKFFCEKCDNVVKMFRM